MNTYVVTTKNNRNQIIPLGKSSYLEWQSKNSLVGFFIAKNGRDAYCQACNLLIDRSFGTIQIDEFPILNIFKIHQQKD